MAVKYFPSLFIIDQLCTLHGIFEYLSESNTILKESEIDSLSYALAPLLFVCVW